MRVGIEAMNVFAGSAYVDVRKLAQHRRLQQARFENLLMHTKSVALPYEDPVTFGVNAAAPLVRALSAAERERIELVITCSESGFDFSKALSCYCHDLLGLHRNCRLIELKSACYSGVAGLQMAANFVLAGTSPGAKALVISTDVARPRAGDDASSSWAFSELSTGAGAAAVLVSDRPAVFEIDVGASGYYGYEVMDTCRPTAGGEEGDTDVSLLSYLDCAKEAFLEYQRRVDGANFIDSFAYLAYHAPFGGMVKGAHRHVMRQVADAAPDRIERDFDARVAPGLRYCQRVGNIMSATTMLSLASTIDHGAFDAPRRVGVFSYGSGCCSEFFSGVVDRAGKARLHAQAIDDHLGRRIELNMAEYDALCGEMSTPAFGTRDITPDRGFLPRARAVHGGATLFLKRIDKYHREYEWVS